MTAEAQPIRIRGMRPDDREFILTLAARLEAVGTPAWRDATSMHAFQQRYAEAAVNAAGAGEAVFMAEHEDGKRLGVVHVLESRDGLTAQPQGYVAMLAVDEATAGRGAGRALMTQAEHWCRERKLEIVALDVFALNTEARGFYAHLGYRDETVTMIKVLST